MSIRVKGSNTTYPVPWGKKETPGADSVLLAPHRVHQALAMPGPPRLPAQSRGCFLCFFFFFFF